MSTIHREICDKCVININECTGKKLTLFISLVFQGNVGSQTILLSSRSKGRGIKWFHNFLHDSQANMSLTDVLFPFLLLFVLILKAWHWQINNLPLGFQMSQQSLSSHADVSVGSDVCNSIWAQRERNSGLWPLARLCILSSLVRCDAKLQSLNTARPLGHMSTVAVVLKTEKINMYYMWCVICIFFYTFVFLPVCLFYDRKNTFNIYDDDYNPLNWSFS